MDSPDIVYSPCHSPLRLFHTLQMFARSTSQQDLPSTAVSLLNRQFVRLGIRKFLFHSVSLIWPRYALFAQWLTCRVCLTICLRALDTWWYRTESWLQHNTDPTTLYAIQTYRASRGTATLIPNLGIICRLVVSLTPPAALLPLPTEWEPGGYGWAGLGVHLDAMGEG